jgi:hypothetical protein
MNDEKDKLINDIFFLRTQICSLEYQYKMKLQDLMDFCKYKVGNRVIYDEKRKNLFDDSKNTNKKGIIDKITIDELSDYDFILTVIPVTSDFSRVNSNIKIKSVELHEFNIIEKVPNVREKLIHNL